MIDARRGRIVNTSPVGGLFGNRPDLRMAIASYSARKVDLIGPALLPVGDACRHITGQTLIVDGGMTCA